MNYLNNQEFDISTRRNPECTADHAGGFGREHRGRGGDESVSEQNSAYPLGRLKLLVCRQLRRPLQTQIATSDLRAILERDSRPEASGRVRHTRHQVHATDTLQFDCQLNIMGHSGSSPKTQRYRDAGLREGLLQRTLTGTGAKSWCRGSAAAACEELRATSP